MAQTSEHGYTVCNSDSCFCHSDCGRDSDGLNLGYLDGVVRSDDEVQQKKLIYTH